MALSRPLRNAIGHRFGLDLLGGGRLFVNKLRNLSMATTNAVREAMHQVDRVDTFQAAPIHKEIERELVAMEVCVRELATLSKEQLERVISWSCSVLAERELRQAQAPTRMPVKGVM